MFSDNTMSLEHLTLTPPWRCKWANFEARWPHVKPVKSMDRNLRWCKISVRCQRCFTNTVSLGEILIRISFCYRFPECWAICGVRSCVTLLYFSQNTWNIVVNSPRQQHFSFTLIYLPVLFTLSSSHQQKHCSFLRRYCFGMTLFLLVGRNRSRCIAVSCWIKMVHDVYVLYIYIPFLP